MTQNTLIYGDNLDLTISDVATDIIPNKGLSLDRQQEFVPVTKGYQLQYKHPNGQLFQGNSFDWLTHIF